MAAPLVPDDPHEFVVNWFYHNNHVLVWETPDESPAWQLRWHLADASDHIVWTHHEGLYSSSDALARVAVITYAVERDQRLVQPNLLNPSDHRAFESLVNKLLAFATASRSSTAQLHHVYR